MRVYAYVGIDKRGKNVIGRMAAPDEGSLEERLRALGLWLVEAKAEKGENEKKGRGGGWSLFGGTGRRELINFCTLMGFQVKVGIPMVTALQVAAEDCENPRFRMVLQDVKHLVESGLPLAESMEKFPNVFAQQMISLVRAGEQSSALPETFMEVKRYLEWQEQVIADVRQATIYPVIVLIIVCLFVLLLFTFVIPKFVMLLTAAKVPLPLATRIVFGASDFAKATWWIWMLGFIGVPVAIQLGRKYSERFAIFFDKVKFKAPLFGELNHMLVISKFAHNLAVLYRSGVPIIQALELCQGLVGSPLLAKVVADVKERVEAGDVISEAMRRHEIFPALLLRMTVMGEKTGNLDHSLENVSEYYNVVVPRKIKKIFSILEPALIIGLVAVVGGVALSIFLPIVSLIGAIR